MDAEVVIIEHCVNCKNHAWFVKHEEAKYHFYYEKVKLAIQSKCPELKVNENIKDKTITDIFNSNPKSFLAYGNSFPRVASFEIYFRGKILYSKLKERKWPNPTSLAEKLRNTLDGVETFNIQMKKIPTVIRNTKGSSEIRSKSVKNLAAINRERSTKRTHLIKTYSQIFNIKDHKTKPKYPIDEIKEEKSVSRKAKTSYLVIKPVVNEKNITPTQLAQEKYCCNDSDGLTNGESYIKHEHSNKEDEESDHKFPIKEPSLPDSNPNQNLHHVEETKLDVEIKNQENVKIVDDKSEKLENEVKVEKEDFSRYTVSRTYEIKLKAGVENPKKFPVNNQNDKDMNLYVSTSDPSVLKFTSNELLVQAGTKGVIKFSLFSPNPDDKTLYLLLKNNGEFLDFYEFKIQFS